MIVPSYKEIVELLKKGLTLEAQEKVMELRGAALELEEENLALRKENAEIRRRIDLRAKVLHKPPFFYFEGEDKALCPKCWQGDEKSVYLEVIPWNGGKLHECSVCGYRNIPHRGVPSTTLHEHDPFG